MSKDPVNPSITEIVKHGNCLGCGSCVVICPVSAIQLVRNSTRGIYLPEVDTEKCNGCGLCRKVCPGEEVLLDELAEEFLDAPCQDARLGRCFTCRIGHACSDELRTSGASGGLITSLLCYGLEYDLIDGALVLGTSESNPLETRPFIARSRQEVLSASGSKYCPSASNLAIREILGVPGRYAAVGLPCQLHALRKHELLNPLLRNRIHYHLGLFCANNNTYFGTEYFLKYNQIPAKEIKSIRYRAGGWPGEIHAETAEGIYRFKRITTETDRKKRALLASAFHFDFAIPRCLVCPDQTAVLADLSFADPHLPEIRETEKKGISWVIARHSKGLRLLDKAVESGIIRLEEWDPEKAKKAQNYAYKERVGGRILLRKLAGQKVPDYGRFKIKRNWTDLLPALSYIPSYFSYRRNLWPLIYFFRVYLENYLNPRPFIRTIINKFKSRGGQQKTT